MHGEQSDLAFSAISLCFVGNKWWFSYSVKLIFAFATSSYPILIASTEGARKKNLASSIASCG